MSSQNIFPMGLTSICIGFDDFAGLCHFEQLGISLLEVEPLNEGWMPEREESTKWNRGRIELINLRA